MEPSLYSAFVGTRLLVTGPWDTVVATARPHQDNLDGPLLVFEHATGRQIELAAAPNPPVKPGPGRPKLGVVSTEVTLLPRHWEWLNNQPARASGTLRRLVEEAMAREATDPRRRREALGRVLWALAGNEPRFEDATRALYADDRPRLLALSAAWSGDLPAFVESWR